MKLSMSKYLAGFAILLSTTLPLQAAGRGTGLGLARGGPGAGRGPAASQRAAADSAEVAALRPAFTLLLGADHDYDGHRVKAMVAIAEACRLMGTDIVPPDVKERLQAVGTGTRPATKPATKPATGERRPEPEAQALSDQQLKQAQSIVQQVRTTIPAGTQPRIAELLDKANTELTTALRIK